MTLEDAIKDHILESRPDLLPESTEISSIDDFDISLADYIDIVSGSASGSWVAIYLASKGTDGALRDVLNQPEIVDRYGKAAPGSAKALLIFFNELLSDAYIPRPPPAPASEVSEDLEGPQSGPGITQTTFLLEGISTVMGELLGNNTLSNQKMTCLIPVTDLTTGVIITMVSDLLEDRTQFGVNNYTYQNPKEPLSPMQSPDTEFVGGLDFLLKDIATAASAGPGMFPGSRITSVDESTTEILGADGFLGVVGNPSFLSLSYASNRMGTNSIENFAILSIGNGGVFGFYEDNAQGGVAQWSENNEIFHMPLILAGNDAASYLNLLYSANPKVQSSQYLRIQLLVDFTDERAEVLVPLDAPKDVPELQTIGTTLAEEYADQIKSFVDKFVFS